MGGLSGVLASLLLVVAMALHLGWTAAGAETAVQPMRSHLQQVQS